MSVSEYISGLEWGNVQEFKNMAVMPIIDSSEEFSIYLTLKEALDMNMLKITEVNDSGSVPQLKAKNMSELPVLILDGEELVGAKQNRVLNTTILLKGDSETLIPVSCTEEGRWSYNSPEFRDEGSVISHSIRGSKRRSVSTFMARRNSYASDQSEIWGEINHNLRDNGTVSPTRSHRDYYQRKLPHIKDYLDAFDLEEYQVGILVFIDGKIKGIDTVSSPVAYKNLHEKLLKSYALEAVLDKNNSKSSAPSKKSEKFIENIKDAMGSVLNKNNSTNTDYSKKSEKFIENIKDAPESKLKSLGHGWDHRFESESVLGSALLCQGEIIHASFFKNEIGGNDNGEIAGYRMRRGFRT
jgi:hypothetical protein